MFNTEITKVSLMDLPHMVTQHTESTKWWYLVADLAAVFKQPLISLLYFLVTEPNLILPLEEAVGEHPVAELFIGLDGIRKYNL